jgi:hypothetical protein
MHLQRLIDLCIDFAIMSRMIKVVAGSLLALSILVWIEERCGPQTNEVVVHVTESDVEVTIGDQTYQIEDRPFAPIACNLAPGWHRLVMRRGDRILFEESFEVRLGENCVRVAGDPDRNRKAHDALQAARLESERSRAGL